MSRMTRFDTRMKQVNLICSNVELRVDSAFFAASTADDVNAPLGIFCYILPNIVLLAWSIVLHFSNVFITNYLTFSLNEKLKIQELSLVFKKL